MYKNSTVEDKLQMAEDAIRQAARMLTKPMRTKAINQRLKNTRWGGLPLTRSAFAPAH
jgi:hypothetical protein